jgi:diguanylate cyclase (GGDEF)-like protein
LANETRVGELAARVGGDEFAIILTQTSLEKAEIFTERIRDSISKINLKEVSNPITLSLGLTELKPDETLDTLFKRADMAMYKAKKMGRNKVWTSD